jgi:hypothetical protein
VGDAALYSNTTGSDNTTIGLLAQSAGNGSRNTATGAFALENSYGNDNTATGYYAMQGDGDFTGVLGSNNTAAGSEALHWLTGGSNNTATGAFAMSGVDFEDIYGSNNTATGFEALSNINIGTNNTATGVDVLFSNTSGNNNTGSGNLALYANTVGFNNTANGVSALTANTTGNYNTADGQGALSANTTGSNNAALGQNALLKNTTGKSNIAIGSNAGFNLTTGSSNIDIGNRGVAGESKAIRVGIQGTQTATFIAGISGTTVPSGVGVIVDTNGHLGTVVSSARFKEAIKPMDTACDAILDLKPVTFHYKQELDPDEIPQFGLVAEQVAKVDPDLVARDEKGKPYTVRYEAVNAMLLNEFLKEHRKVEALEAAMAKMQATIEKVSARLELSKGAPRVVASEP